jgi:hypothetical protein
MIVKGNFKPKVIENKGTKYNNILRSFSKEISKGGVEGVAFVVVGSDGERFSEYKADGRGVLGLVGGIELLKKNLCDAVIDTEEYV